jgi:hypothetical protein
VKNRLVPTLALASALLLSGAAQQTPAAHTPSSSAPRSKTVDPKEALVRKLLTLSGAGNLGKQVVDAMMDQFKQMPNLPPGFTEKFKEMARPDEIVELIVPVYVKSYDTATLQAVVDFYQSDAGRAFVAKQPLVFAESQKAGQRWGTDLAQKVLAELQGSPPPATH